MAMARASAAGATRPEPRDPQTRIDEDRRRSTRLAEASHGRSPDQRSLVDRVERGAVAGRELAGLAAAEARVHDRATDGRAARGTRDQDRADAAVAFIGGRAAAADGAVEEVRVTEADRVAELVGDDVLDGVDAERRAIEARTDVDRAERPA